MSSSDTSCNSNLARRGFLKCLGATAVLPLARDLKFFQAVQDTASSAPVLRLPQPIGSPVLDSLPPVIKASRHVRTNVDRIVEVASWMAYEELPLPEFALPFGLGAGDQDQTIDFLMVADTIDFAFTDFSSNVKFQVDYAGEHWSDSNAMFACLKRGLDEGRPLLDGNYLQRIRKADLEQIFRGNIEMPMLEERVAIFHEVGSVLQNRYNGRFHNFVKSASPRLYDDGRGLVEKLVSEFPRFRDVSTYNGHEIKLYKLAQLSLWMMYSALRPSGTFRLDDAEKMSAFADYIVPAALRVMGIISYSPRLENAIQTHQIIGRDSQEEIEIRAHTLYATALLREEINRLRPPEMHIIIPQVDARLWTHYHTTFWPHHLTRTIMY